MVTPEPFRLTHSASAYLDAFRALAALTVMLSHVRGLLFVEYSQVQTFHLTLIVKALYLATRSGHQSVMVFFVLSGFLIASSVLRKIHDSTWSWADYALNRLVRLYTVLIPGLLLGWAWDSIGAKVFNSSGIYTSAIPRFGTKFRPTDCRLQFFSAT